jgi:GH24 family phage-related lysozyme (muramidase)
MASENILKSFMVRIGFKVDEQQLRNFQEAMRVTAKNAVEMGKTMLAASTVAGGSLKVAAQHLESLYFASQRTGASAAHLKEFAFAASQIGVSAEQAQGAIESLAAARRSNPGLNGILGGMGIDPRQADNSKVMLELLGKLHSMPFYQGSQIASMFGIDPQTFLMLEKGLPQMKQNLLLREKMFAQAGMNPDDWTKSSNEFMTQLRTMLAGLGDLADIMAYRLMPAGEKVIGWLQGIVEWLAKADKATDGWSSKILGVATALTGGSLLKGGFGMLGKFLGGGGAAAGAEGAAAAGGEGLLAGIALPVIVGAAIVAALTWMELHPDKVRKAAATAWKFTRNLNDKGLAATKAEIHALPGQMKSAVKASVAFHQQVQAAGGYAAVLSASPGVLGTVARMAMAFEGHAKSGYGVYRDMAGHLTAGFGHLVKRGEDFSHLDQQGALALLAKDMKASMASVMKLVKVHLTGNQADALADFVFNLGSGALAKSTLLKKLNSGDFNGAADQFQHWNKVLQNGHYIVSGGLSSRRAAEASLFRTPDKGVVLNQKTDIHVTGGDAHDTAREVSRQQGRVNGDMVRNFAGAGVQ